MNFQEMSLSTTLLDAVRESGYVVPTPIQEATVPVAMAGKDVLGCAQTGSGKTAAFVLPILQKLGTGRQKSDDRQIRSLILVPTRELAIQNYDCFVRLGVYTDLCTAVIYGGVSQNPQVEAIKSGVDVLVATPGRLNDLIRQGFISLEKLEIFVLDEADRMLDMGFIHDVKAIIRLLPRKRQTLLFSATMPKEVEELALGLLNDPVTVKVDPVTGTGKKIKQSVYFVARENKKKLLFYLLTEGGVSTALVFTRTKGNADQIARFLNKNGIDAMAIHGDKSQTARQKALSSFKAGKIGVLVATDIAARGIDIVELPYVVNYNIPEEPETYIHRIGRTGRAGQGGAAISICSAEELKDWRAIEKLTKASIFTADCEWSVKDMLPCERVRQTRPPQATAKSEKRSAAKPSKMPRENKKKRRPFSDSVKHP